MLVDLTQPIRPGMTVVPGDPLVDCRPALTLADDGVAVTGLRLGSHTGTHVDAPAHVVPGGRTVDRVDLGELTGEALVLRVDGLAPGEVITLARLGDLPAAVPARVLMATGWDRHLAAGPTALRHPVLAPDVAVELLDWGMRVLGVDTLSPDATLQHGPPALPVHARVLGADGLIVENLTGLTALPRRVRVGVFPLPLADGDAAPVRAVAWV
ncbi:cyclase [Tersicoccus solisilvae]|uniref:Cyclase n=1 Tax=Tersicoccus solisilvae TaxID=1882339 RepID=A0ABQ1NLP3_9MICC|nr:cyclase family protein [Tersicoccus solisilvae]GGC78302.1 cyclase [Tersicoccus solisilvae]